MAQALDDKNHELKMTHSYVESPEISAIPWSKIDSIRRHLLDNCQIALSDKRDDIKPILKWTQCGLSEPILSTLSKLRYDAPTALQSQAIPFIMSGRDVVCVAPKGSGKTLSYVLPLTRRMLPSSHISVIILCSTIDLAKQIAMECNTFACFQRSSSAHISNKSTNLQYASSSICGSVSQSHFIVGNRIMVTTPDSLSEAGSWSPHQIQVLVLDDTEIDTNDADIVMKQYTGAQVLMFSTGADMVMKQCTDPINFEVVISVGMKHDKKHDKKDGDKRRLKSRITALQKELYHVKKEKEFYVKKFMEFTMRNEYKKTIQPWIKQNKQSIMAVHGESGNNSLWEKYCEDVGLKCADMQFLKTTGTKAIKHQRANFLKAQVTNSQ
eukprot:178865_1